MPVNPIQLFQSGQSNFLSDYLNGATNVIGHIFDTAIQQGRDSVNNQMKQGSDMMSQRNFETNMAQRRGENLQQNNEDAQRNARNIFESDRKFDYVAGQDVLQSARMNANDIFSQGMQEKNYELNAGNVAADNTRADGVVAANQERVAADEAQRLKNQKFYEDVYAPTQQTKTDFKTGFLNEFNGVQPQSAEGMASLRIKLQAAQKAGDANAVRSIGAQMDRAAPTWLQQDTLARKDRAEGRTVAAIEDRATTTSLALAEKDLRLLTADTTSFPRQEPQALRKDATDEASVAEGTAYDAKSFESEVNSARNMTEAEYIKGGKNGGLENLNAEQIAKRREIWNFARNSTPAQSDGEATTPTSQAPTRKYNPATGKFE